MLFAWILAACQPPPAQVTPVSTTVASTSPTPRPVTPVPSSTASPTPKADLSALRGLKIEFWHSWSGAMISQVDALVSEFNRNNEWGIQVSVRRLDGASGLKEVMGAAQKDNMLPQALAAPSDLIIQWQEDKSGWLTGLDTYLSDPTTGLKQADFNPLFWEQDHASSAQAGIPAVRNAVVLFYNLTWAKELGFQTLPMNTEDFHRQSCAAAKENNRSPDLNLRGTGGWIIDDSALGSLSWLTAFGASEIPDAGSKKFTFNTPQAQAALDFLHTLQSEGCIWDNKNPLPYEAFTDRRALFYTGTLQDFSPQMHLSEKGKSKDQWTLIPFPGKNGQPTVYASGESYGVVKSTPEKQLAAWLFIRWLSQPENQSRLAAVYPSLPVRAETTSHESTPGTIGTAETLLLPALKAAPNVPSWRVVGELLEDAVWQVFRLSSADQLKQILPQLDAMVEEMLTRSQ